MYVCVCICIYMYSKSITREFRNIHIMKLYEFLNIYKEYDKLM